jgi:anti-sigma regulatory factor (Ser/Thr protein kinase)
LLAVGEIHCLTLRNDRAEIARMMMWIDRLVAPFGLSPHTIYALQLCLEEAISNVVSHAFEPRSKHDVHLALWCDDTALHAEVTDDGRPFDPLSYELPAAPKDLQSAQIGGLGIKLMRSFAGELIYERSGSTNRLRMSFPLN